MQPTTISQPILTQPINIQPSTITQSTFTQPILTQSVLTQPVTTINQPVVTQQVLTQPLTNTIPVSNQPILETSMTQIGQDPIIQEPGVIPANANDLVTPTGAIKSDFGKIKALEVLTFKEAELERTLSGRTTFATVGNLQVLYFPNFDRFVLSLNDWKYTLLRRIPIVGSGAGMTGPVQYTLPTYNGFYTLRLNKIPYVEAVQNLETILAENSKLSYLGTDNILKRDLSPDDRFRGQTMVDPTNPVLGSLEGSQAQTQYLPEASKPTNMMSRGQKIKRGFKMLGFKLTKGLSRKGKHNMNHLQQRDIDTIKRTSEITVPTHMYPRKEVERWISYSKEIASRNGFEPELAPDYEPGMGSPLQEGRMRGYGSVDLGQGFVSDPAWMGISSEPLDIMQMQGVSGTIGAGPSHSKHVLYTKPSKMDKLKSKLPGTHRYSGEKIEGYTFPTHAVQTHHGFGDKLKTKIVGHDQFTHQGLADATTGVGVTQSLYTGPAVINPSGQAYTGTPNFQSTTSSQGTAYTGAPIYSGPAIYAGSQGTVIGPATTNNPVINQGEQIISGVSQPIITQSQQRLQSNLASNIPTQHVDILRGQEYLAPDQA